MAFGMRRVRNAEEIIRECIRVGFENSTLAKMSESFRGRSTLVSKYVGQGNCG